MLVGVWLVLRESPPRYVEKSFRRIRPRALDAARQIKADIQQRTGHCLWVQAVVVFWSDFPEQLVEALASACTSTAHA